MKISFPSGSPKRLGKVMGFQQDTLEAVRMIAGKTVLFLCVPTTEAAAR